MNGSIYSHRLCCLNGSDYSVSTCSMLSLPLLRNRRHRVNPAPWYSRGVAKLVFRLPTGNSTVSGSSSRSRQSKSICFEVFFRSSSLCSIRKVQRCEASMSEVMKTLSTPLVLDLLSTTQQTSSPSSNETRLLTLCSVSRDRRRLTNMLMVTTLSVVSMLYICV